MDRAEEYCPATARAGQQFYPALAQFPFQEGKGGISLETSLDSGRADGHPAIRNHPLLPAGKNAIIRP